MAGDGVTASVQGLPELREAFRSLVPKLRRRALAQELRAAARTTVLREAKRRTPVLKRTTRSGANALRRGVRAVGTVQRALAVRTSKAATRRGDVGVFVNVRPAKGSARGANNPRDPFYWRWLNFGWNPAADRSNAGRRERRRLNAAGAAKAKQGAQFLLAGARMLPAALRAFVAGIVPRIARLNSRKGIEP